MGLTIHKGIGVGVQLGTKVNYFMLLTSTGTGVSTGTLKMRVSADVVLTLSGDANFYTNSEATLSESKTFTLTQGALRTVYIKVTSGVAKLYPSDITKIIGVGDFNNYGWISSTNAPSLSFDVSKFINTTCLKAAGQNTIYGSISNLLLLQIYDISNFSTCSGDTALLSALAYLTIGSFNTITPSRVNLATALIHLEIPNNYALTTSNINQLLADMWLNKDAAKYPSGDRTIYLLGSATNKGPSGQGIIDADALKAYRSPTPPGTAAFWAVTTRPYDYG